MLKIQSKTVFVTLVILMTLGLNACTSKIRDVFSTDSVQVDYQNNQSVKQLEVPPDLTQPEFDSAFELPKGVVSAASLNSGGAGVVQSSASATSNVAAASRRDLSSIKTVANKSILQINDTYPRALIMTEIMLGRMGFTTVSKSPSGNVITAKYTGRDINADDGEKISWTRKVENMFVLGNADRIKANKALVNGKNYFVNISNAPGAPTVNIKRADNTVISDASHSKIISLLNAAFNR